MELCICGVAVVVAFLIMRSIRHHFSWPFVSLFIRIFACCNKSTKVCSPLFFSLSSFPLLMHAFSLALFFLHRREKKTLFCIKCNSCCFGCALYYFCGFVCALIFYSFLSVYPSKVDRLSQNARDRMEEEARIELNACTVRLRRWAFDNSQCAEIK